MHTRQVPFIPLIVHWKTLRDKHCIAPRSWKIVSCDSYERHFSPDHIFCMFRSPVSENSGEITGRCRTEITARMGHIGFIPLFRIAPLKWNLELYLARPRSGSRILIGFKLHASGMWEFDSFPTLNNQRKPVFLSLFFPFSLRRNQHFSTLPKI